MRSRIESPYHYDEWGRSQGGGFTGRLYNNKATWRSGLKLRSDSNVFEEKKCKTFWSLQKCVILSRTVSSKCLLVFWWILLTDGFIAWNKSWQEVPRASSVRGSFRLGGSSRLRGPRILGGSFRLEGSFRLRGPEGTVTLQWRVEMWPDKMHQPIKCQRCGLTAAGRQKISGFDFLGDQL